MSAQPAKVNLTLQPNDNSRLANLCGPFDEHLHQIEQRLSVEIHHRGNSFTVEGNAAAAESAAVVIKNLYNATDSEELSKETIHLHLQDSHVDSISNKG